MNDQKREIEEYFLEGNGDKVSLTQKIQSLTDSELRILFPERNDFVMLSYDERLKRYQEALEKDEICLDQDGLVQKSNFYRVMTLSLHEESLRKQRRLEEAELRQEIRMKHKFDTMRALRLW
jgi:hypothetical protein